MKSIKLFFMLLCLSSLSFAGTKAYIATLNIKAAETQTTFIFSLSKKTYGKVKYFPNDHKLMLEFANAYKNFALQNVKLANANVTAVTSEKKNGGVRFIFTVKNKIKWNINFLPPLQNQIKLQLTLFSDNAVIQQPILTKVSTDTVRNEMLTTFASLAARAKEKMTDDQLTGRARFAQQKSVVKKPSTFIVVIDPGHGGADSGAKGDKGAEEKNVVLAIAKALMQRINHTTGMKAVLTRTGDYYLSLRERLVIARKANADLFVAIHADAYFDEKAHGASVYALSPRGASSEAARWLAKRENHSELGGVELNALQDDSRMLRSVLIDLAQTTTIQDSMLVGNKILDSLDEIAKLHHSHVEQAPFVVLKSPDIPSVLVETGFISNPREERRLTNPQYQAKVAQAIWQGILKSKTAIGT